MPGIPFLPQQASTIAGPVDTLLLFMLVLTAIFTLLVATGIVYFSIRYRRRSPNEVPVQLEGSNKLEVAWTVIPFGLAMVVFFWGANLYMHIARPPDDSMEVYVIGKQWMWKFVHATGQEEINELHIPVGRNIKLTMASQDVIHSFFVPAFRAKADVLPQRYTTLWFNATQPGQYHLFCTQYCGTDHAEMTGWIYALEPAAFQTWSGGGTGLAAQGAQLFNQLGCIACHRAEGGGQGPSLVGVFGRSVPLQDGQTVVADENYIRESILNPTAKIVAGYQPIMPTYQGRVSEEQLLQLIEYFKSLSAPSGAAPTPLASPARRSTP